MPSSRFVSATMFGGAVAVSAMIGTPGYVMRSDEPSDT